MIERMDEFFAARVDGYDEHMLTNVQGCRAGYEKMAELVPEGTKDLLDLGCGTGLELEKIYQKLPDLSVTGIDLTGAMLDKLRAKFPDKRLNLILGSYFDVPLGEARFDCAVSFQTMHHFERGPKKRLYQAIRRALRPGGRYIECDYMVISQREQDHWFRENARLRREQGIPDGAFFHCDTPMTVENQIRLLLDAGFQDVRRVWREQNTTLVVAVREL